MGLLLALAPTATLADEPIALEQITVEASPADAMLPARTVVDRDEIIESHKDDLSDVLELTPGVNVRDGGRGEPRINVRGFDQRAVLFTLNGVPIYEPWNGIINLNLFPLEMLDSIAIERGPSSSLYGPNGMGGTVKLTTIQPSVPVTANASTIWRDSDTWDARASASVAGNGAVGLIGGRYFSSPGFPLPGDFSQLPSPQRKNGETGGLRNQSDREDESLFSNLAYDYSDQGRLHATVIGSHSSFGIPPSTTSFSGPFLHADYQDLLHAQAGVEQRLTPGVGVAAAVFDTAYDTQETEFTASDFAEKKLTTTDRSNELGGLARVTLDFAAVDSLAVAAQVRRDDADVSDSFNGHRAGPHFTTSSVAAENVVQVGARVSLVTGLSLDMQSGGPHSLWEPDPQGGMFVDFGDWGSSHVAVSRKIRFPTLGELYDPAQGAADLRPEKAIVYEAGHRVQLARGYAAFSLFRSDVTDLIVNNGDQRFQNLQAATLQGLEVAVGGRPVSWAQLDVNYTYLDTWASTTSVSGPREAAVQHRPPHRFNGVLRIFLPFAIVMRLEGLYSAAQSDQFGNPYAVVDAYTLFNAQLSRRFGKYVQLFAGADNLLDSEHEDKLGAPGAGRWVFSGLRLTYD